MGRDLTKASKRLYAKLANIQLKAAYANKRNSKAIGSYAKKSAAAIRVAKASLNARLNTLGNVIASNARKVEAGMEVLTGVIRSHRTAGKLDRKLIRQQTKAMGQDMQKAIARAIQIGEAKARRLLTVPVATLPAQRRLSSSRSPSVWRLVPTSSLLPSRVATRRLRTTTCPSRLTL